MLTNYIFMVPIKSKSTGEVIKAYLTGVYSLEVVDMFYVIEVENLLLNNLHF